MYVCIYIYIVLVLCFRNDRSYIGVTKYNEIDVVFNKSTQKKTFCITKLFRFRVSNYLARRDSYRRVYENVRFARSDDFFRRQNHQHEKPPNETVSSNVSWQFKMNSARLLISSPAGRLIHRARTLARGHQLLPIQNPWHEKNVYRRPPPTPPKRRSLFSDNQTFLGETRVVAVRSVWLLSIRKTPPPGKEICLKTPVRVAPLVAGKQIEPSK